MIPNLFAQNDAPKAQSSFFAQRVFHSSVAPYILYSRYLTKRSEFVVLQSDNNTAANDENVRRLLPFWIFSPTIVEYKDILRYVVL